MAFNVDFNAVIAAVVALLFYTGAVFAGVEAVIKARTAQGAIAWVIALIFMPFVAVPLYLILGRNRFNGYLEQRAAIEVISKKVFDDASAPIAQHIVTAKPDSSVLAALRNLTSLPATSGNEVQLLINGQQTFDSIIQGISQAQRYVLVQFYIIRTDEQGKRLADALIERVRCGVRVHLLFDEIGSRSFLRSDLNRQLKEAGAKVSPFNTTQGAHNRFQLNFRNHRKVVVVDGQQAWIGGHNIGNEYLGMGNRWGEWRDTHVRLSGPAVLAAQLVFASDWHWATRTYLDLELDVAAHKTGDSAVLVFPSDPAGQYEVASLMYHQVIVAAKQRIWIASPYFIPDRGIVSALQLAALRGVDVNVMIPDEPDGPVVAMANWAFTKELLPVGVKFHRYQHGFMHQKVFLVDDCLAGVGTANFDNRSFRFNFEITVLIEDEKFAGEVADMLEQDRLRCFQVTAGDLAEKPGWFHLAMGAARLLSPIL